MKYFLLAFMCLAVTAQSQQASPFFAKTPFVLGETVQIQSGELGENRTLNIYLPPGYGQDSTRKYSVIYVLDGSADEDFIHIVGLVQFATFPWIKMIPESIVVGIANVDRKRDFTFPSRNVEDRKNTPTAGGSERFIRFIERELQPFIDRQYRADTVRTLIGQSLGGLVGTEILFKKPDLFTHYILVSPSLWWDDESLLKLARRAPARPVNVYLAAGKDEHPVMVRTAQELAGLLRQDTSDRVQLIFNIMDGQDHGNILHLAVYEAFGQLFGKGKGKGH